MTKRRIEFFVVIGTNRFLFRRWTIGSPRHVNVGDKVAESKERQTSNHDEDDFDKRGACFAVAVDLGSRVGAIAVLLDDVKRLRVSVDRLIVDLRVVRDVTWRLIAIDRIDFAGD